MSATYTDIVTWDTAHPLRMESLEYMYVLHVPIEWFGTTPPTLILT